MFEFLFNCRKIILLLLINILLFIKMSTNYEKLYNDLKEEFEQNKSDTDEIMKEYESTIKMLTDTAEALKREKENFQKQLAESIKKQKQLQSDLENYKNKNIDKMKDIEILNTKNEKLTQELQKMTQNKTLIESKVVTLENDNDHYLGKIRENEARIEDLNLKLESALEENISLQTDFETYKQMSEESLIRKEQELKDAKNEIINKDKIILRLNRKDSVNIKQFAHKIIFEKQRKMSVPINININTSLGGTHTITNNNINNTAPNNPSTSNTSNNSNNSNNSNFVRKDKLNRTWSTGELMNSIITPVIGSNKKLPEKFVEMYSKSCLSEVDDKKGSAKKSNTINTKTEQNKIEEANEAESEEGNLESDSSTEKREFDIIEYEKGNSFDILSIEKPEKILTKNNSNNNNSNKKNQKQIADNLKEMLSRIQQRKSELLHYRKSINEKLEKIGVKIR